MKTVFLPSGEPVLIDARDLELWNRYTWLKHSTGKGKGCYVSCLREGKRIYLHRLIAGGELTHHKNGNWADCTRGNLIPTDSAGNARGFRQRAARYPSRHRGVGFYKRYQKWRAQIMVNYVQKFLGYFETEEYAARAYDEAAKRYFGDIAQLNFPTLPASTPNSEAVSRPAPVQRLVPQAEKP